jgi:penicillin V acylase-like amidase (Ntn superfamily)
MFRTIGAFRIRATFGTIAGLAVAAFAGVQAADACSRILWNDNKLAVVVGRTMDWPESTQPKLMVFPRGVARDGGRVGTDTVVKDNAARWTAKFGSLVTSI